VIVKRNWKNFLIIAIVACVYVLLLMTKDIQEDAYITFRVAFNLADHRVFSFNLDEQYSSVTSFLYPLGIAFFRLIFGGFAIPAVQVVNAVTMLGACWVFAKVLRGCFSISGGYQIQIWFLLALLPQTLVLSVRSMEMPYVVFLFAVGLRWLQVQTQKHQEKTNEVQGHGDKTLGLLVVGFLPFVRPDAVAFSLVLVGVAFFIRRMVAVWCMTAIIIGSAVYLMLNYILQGRVLPNTIAAKLISYNAFSFSDLFNSWTAVMNEVAFPVDVKYLYSLKPLCGMVAVVIVGVLFRSLWKKKQEQIPILSGMVIAIFAIPSVYVVGGVIFPWYLWPSQFLCAGVILGGIVYFISQQKYLVVRRICWIMVIGSGLLMMSFQLMRSYNWGVMEGVYRTNIGKYLSRISKSGDVLFLEPAGYIPYYSGLKTVDEIGLTSPIVLKYKKQSPQKWWINCVVKERPMFLVQRENFVNYCTDQGYKLTANEIVWFNRNYNIIKQFRYTPEEYTHNLFLLRLLRLSSTHDYYVFKLRESDG